MMEMFNVNCFIKGGGTEALVITDKMMIDLLKKLKTDGSVMVHTTERSVCVTGLLIKGREFDNDQRIIVNGTEFSK